MTFKKILLFCFIPFLNYAQTEVYLDEDKKPINATTFKNKCKSHITKCLDYKSDSLIIHKVLYKYSFGKIDASEYKQIKGLLASQTKKKIDSNATIILKYSDTLQSLKILETNYNKHILVCPVHHFEKTLKDFRDDRNKWVKAREKCINKFEDKNNLSVNYIYRFDKGALQSYNTFQWIKDRGIFKNMFFKDMYANNLVILKSNGEYFLSGDHLSDKSVSKLIQTDDWIKYKKDWKSSTTTHLKKGKGLFNNGFISHKSHCF